MTTYILDSHPLMCQAIASLLRRIDPARNIVEVSTYSKLQEFILKKGQPQAFVIDPVMLGIQGTIGIQTIKGNYPTIPLILFSSIPREEAEKGCIAAGADLYIEKTTQIKLLYELFKNALNLRNELESILRKNSESEGIIKFTKRQKQLLILIDSGLGNEDIARELGISSHTVKVHLWRFYKKMNVNSRTQLVKKSRDLGYL